MGNHSLRYRGIVIKTVPYADADIIVSVLAEDGEKHVSIAKQARKSRKRFGSSLDLFDIGNFEASQGKGGLPILQSFIPQAGLRNLRDSLSKISCASVIVESIDLLVPEAHGDDSHAPIFRFLEEGLKQINDSADIKIQLRALYHTLVNILETSGYHAAETSLPASLHSLRSILIQIERSTERKLKTRESLDIVSAELKKASLPHHLC